MNRLHEMDVFVKVVAAGSFAQAARALRLSPPAVTRAVSGLEERLGVRLLNRTTRSLSLTEAGQRFLEHARRLLADVEDAEQDVKGQNVVPEGHLTITTSASFGVIALAPLLAAHPRITVSLMLLDRVVNLVDEGIDVAVRLGHLPDSSLVARRVGEVRRVVVASPNYTSKRGRPERPADLALHSIVGFTGLAANSHWPFSVDGQLMHVAITPRLEVNDAGVAIAAAEAGDGITSTLCYMVGDGLRTGRLVPVLEDCWPEPSPVQIVYPSSRLLAAKVRAFVDWSAPRLSETLRALSAHKVSP
jgi:DNA-binding transcriptional LysR family regulator